MYTPTSSHENLTTTACHTALMVLSTVFAIDRDPSIGQGARVQVSTIRRCWCQRKFFVNTRIEPKWWENGEWFKFQRKMPTLQTSPLFSPESWTTCTIRWSHFARWRPIKMPLYVLKVVVLRIVQIFKVFPSPFALLMLFLSLASTSSSSSCVKMKRPRVCRLHKGGEMCLK